MPQALNKLINILNARRSNFSGGRQHDSIKELNMGLQFITIGIALPVQINHDSIKFVSFSFFLVLGTLSHQNLQDLCEPFLHLSSLQIFAKRIESVSLTLELSRGVNLVCHDAGNGLLHILHPLSHLGVSHLIDLLDKLIILLPETHLEAL